MSMAVRLPDGRTVQVQTSDPQEAARAGRLLLAREALQRQQARGPARPNLPGPLKGVSDYLNGVTDAAVNGMTFGTIGPIEAGARALTTGAGNLVKRAMGQQPQYTAGDVYAAQRLLDNGDQRQFAATHPVSATTAGILGGFAAPGSELTANFINKGAQVLPGAKGVLPALVRTGNMAARSAAVGGLLGGVSGASNANPGQEASGAVRGAEQGALIGAAVPVASKVAEGLTNAVVSPVVNTVKRAANRAVVAAGGPALLDPMQQAGQRLSDALRRDGASPEQIRDVLGQWLKSGVTPTLMDVASSLPNGGQATLGLLRGAALKAGPARGMAMDYNDQTEASLAGRAVNLARGLTPDKRSAQTVQDALEEARGTLANEQYREPYAMAVDTSPVMDALGGQAGKDAVRAATKAADANRLTDELRELQGIRDAAAPPPPEPVAAAPAPRPAAPSAPAGPDWTASGPAQALQDVRDYRAGQPGSLFAAIRAKGGVKLRGVNGAPVPGPDVEPYLDGIRRPGLVNNASGMSGENMAQALADEGWFGPNPGDPFDAFTNAFQREARGQKVFHPSAYEPGYEQRMAQIERDLSDAEVAAADSHKAAASKLWELRNGDNAEREAIQAEANLNDPAGLEFDRLSAPTPAPQAGAPIPPVVRLGTLDQVKQAFNQMGRDAEAKGNGRLAAGFYQRAKDLDQYLGDRSFSYELARDNFHQGSNRLEGIKLGRTGLEASPDDYAATMADLQSRVQGQGPSPAQLDAGVGYRQEITDRLAHQPAGAIGTLKRLGTAEDQTANLATTYGPNAAANFQAGLNNLRRQVANSRFIDPSTGSQTAGRASDALDLKDVAPPRLSALGTVFDIINKVRRGATLTDEERAALVHLGTAQANAPAVADLPLALPYNPSKPLTSGLAPALSIYGGAQ